MPQTVVFGMMGDLGESLLKRSTGVKDSGGIVPGHGGILDRVDAVLITAPGCSGCKKKDQGSKTAKDGNKDDGKPFGVEASMLKMRASDIAMKIATEAVDLNKGQPVPEWLDAEPSQLRGKVVQLPKREDVPHPINEQLIVELCSR